MPSESVMIEARASGGRGSSPVIAAVDSEAGSPALVRPGTSAWVTMIAGTLATMAASNGTRSRPRRVSMSETLSGALWGSVVPRADARPVLHHRRDPGLGDRRNDRRHVARHLRRVAPERPGAEPGAGSHVGHRCEVHREPELRHGGHVVPVHLGDLIGQLLRELLRRWELSDRRTQSLDRVTFLVRRHDRGHRGLSDRGADLRGDVLALVPLQTEPADVARRDRCRGFGGGRRQHHEQLSRPPGLRAGGSRRNRAAGWWSSSRPAPRQPRGRCPPSSGPPPGSRTFLRRT